jgi:hypothetical protein
MKRKKAIFLALIMLSCISILYSCAGKVSTTGTLSITAVTKDGPPTDTVPIPVYLSISKEKLDKQVYVASGYLNTSGSIIFRELAPKYYWYRVGGWNNYGASEVVNGLDESVILWLNTPGSKK